MITFIDSKEKMKETEKCLDSQLWHACAGSMVQMPSVSSIVFYFPQGHAEHASGNVDFRTCPRIPSYLPCRVSAVKFMADPDSDEVYAKIRLIPLSSIGEDEIEDDGFVGSSSGTDSAQSGKPTSFAKTLTQSDANNGGGFSVPRYCAETIFPPLDYSADPPVQTILAKDVHGEIWKFRHIYRGTPRRHLLTTGWSTFVNHKKLVAGDSIVFLRAENEDLCVGIRRAKRGMGGGSESSVGWNPAGGNCVMPYGGFSSFLRDDENKFVKNGNGGSEISCGMFKGKGKVTAESVVEAVTLAANGQPFEIVYYPRASTPEFCVKASLVKSALQIRWGSGLRFKMPFETEDSSRISWFMGTVSSVKVSDPIRWPDSPWRLLQVAWDEPDLLQNVKRVSPWLVELVSNMPSLHLSPFSPPRKKLRLPQHPDFPLDSQLPMPTFSGNLLGLSNPYNCRPDISPAGIQGARHAQYGRSIPDLHLNRLHSAAGLFPAGFPLLDHIPITRPPPPSNPIITHKPTVHENEVSCLLTMSTCTPAVKKTPQLVLFGKPILTEQQISQSVSGEAVSPVCNGNSSGSGSGEADSKLETGHCKVFMESEDVGRTLDLTLLGSYEELYMKLANMFGIESSEMLNRVMYRDAMGTVKHVGDEPFSEFAKTARKLTIVMDSSSNNNVGG